MVVRGYFPLLTRGAVRMGLGLESRIRWLSVRALELVEEDHFKTRPRETGRMVAAHRREVEAVAQALLARGRLEAPEIYRIVAGVRP